MFDLAECDLAGPVMDCCAGGSSLVAEVAGRGGMAVAVDPVYRLSPAELVHAVRESAGQGASIIHRNPDRFVWDWYGTPERRDRLRAAAASRFVVDITRRPQAYVAAELPRLPFRDAAVELVLSSHLLFTWSDRLDASWHRAALREMVRVTRREVRVFPLVVQGTGAAVPFLEPLCDELRADGLVVTVRRVPYTFQRGADTMLAVMHR